jgi:hypothetical protein
MRAILSPAAILAATILMSACSRSPESADTDPQTPLGDLSVEQATAGSGGATLDDGVTPAGIPGQSEAPAADQGSTEDTADPVEQTRAARRDALKTPLPVDDYSAGDEALHAELDATMRSSTPVELWAEWDRVTAGGNPREIDMLSMALGDRLRERPDSAIIAELSKRLVDPMTDSAQALSLVEVLELAASPESLVALLDYLDAADAPLPDEMSPTTDDDTQQDLRTRVLQAIDNTVRADYGSGPDWAMSPVLETALREATPARPEDEVATVAGGLAALGSPTGTQALLDVAATPDSGGTDVGLISRKAISSLERIDPIPVLREALANPRLPAAIQDSVMDGLVSIGRADAAIEIVQHLADTPEISNARLQALETTMVDRNLPPESLKVIEDALHNAEIPEPRITQLFEGVLESADPDWRTEQGDTEAGDEQDPDALAESESSAAAQVK